MIFKFHSKHYPYSTGHNTWRWAKHFITSTKSENFQANFTTSASRVIRSTFADDTAASWVTSAGNKQMKRNDTLASTISQTNQRRVMIHHHKQCLKLSGLWRVIQQNSNPQVNSCRWHCFNSIKISETARHTMLSILSGKTFYRDHWPPLSIECWTPVIQPVSRWQIDQEFCNISNFVIQYSIIKDTYTVPSHGKWNRLAQVLPQKPL